MELVSRNRNIGGCSHENDEVIGVTRQTANARRAKARKSWDVNMGMHLQ